MTGKHGNYFFVSLIAGACIIMLMTPVLSSCAGNAAHEIVEEHPLEEPAAENTTTGSSSFVSRLIVPSPQETAFNGHPQPLSFSYSGDDTPLVIYYPSLWALEDEKGGTLTAPTRVGIYYVLVRCRDEETYAEYRIVKCPVIIIADENQEAVYDGNPKRIQAQAEPPVLLNYSYYPNSELMEAAIRTVKEASPGLNSTQVLSQMFQGYRRVERAPTEQGTYYVWIYYPGDDNHLASEKRVVFTILPAVPLRPR